MTHPIPPPTQEQLDRDQEVVKERKYPVIEVFGPTIQGEGIQTGHLTHFIRFGGCGYRCRWCDSMHAVDPAQVKANRRMLSVEQIAQSVVSLPKAPWITLTGGDPCMHDLTELVTWAMHNGYSTCVETQGEFWPKWLYEVDVVTLSPKGPSSGNITSQPMFVEELVQLYQRCRGQICIKPVVFDQADVSYALELLDRLDNLPIAPPYAAFHFQVGSPLTAEVPAQKINEAAIGVDYEKAQTMQILMMEEWKRRDIFDRYQWLVHTLSGVSDRFNSKVAITPQLHTLLWPLEDTGR